MSFRWRSAPAEARPALVLAVVAAAATAVLSSAMVAAVREGRALESAVESELLSVAELQASRVAQWRHEREQDLRFMLDVPSLARAADALARGDRSADEDTILELWRSVAQHSSYDDVQLVTASGGVLLSASGATLHPETLEAVQRALATRAPAWSDFHDLPGAGLGLDLVGPVLAPDGTPVAAVVLAIEPRAALYPALATWPRPSETAESLLVQRHGEGVLIVSPRRSAELPTATPLSRRENPAVQAALGRTGVMRGTRRSGAAVVAAMRPVSGSPWVVVTCMDEGEAAQPARSRFRIALLLGTAAAVLATAVAATVWWRRAVRLVRAGRAEQERERVAMARHYDLLARHADDVVLLMTAGGRIIEVNDRAAEVYGWSRDELLGMTIRDLRAPGASGAGGEEARGDGELRLETVHRRRDGSTVPVEVSSRTFDAAGATYCQSIVRDLSAEKAAQADRERLQEQVFISERMASLGTLAAGIAHEINNPLSFVVSNVRYAASELDSGAADLDEVKAALADAAEGGRRVHEIVRDLKTFARGDSRAGSTDDLASVVRSTVTLAQNEIKYRARLSVEVPSLPPVKGAPHRLGQVFLNLLVNAAQALPEGRVDEHEIRVRAGTSGDRVWVEVADDGPGVPPELRQRIFDPFFTTKPLGVGTGLGLSICHGIVTAAGGNIALVPSPRGAAFRVELVRAPAAVATAATPPPTLRSARVLVVDDEPRVGRALQRLLQPQHEVVYAANAREALGRLERDGRFDVVLCDVMMPEVTGIELFDEIARRDPHLARRVAFITGGAFTPRTREFLESSPNPKLEKPFDVVAVQAVVSRLARA